MPIYDVTLPLSSSLPVWPGDPPVEMERIRQAGVDSPYSLSRLSLGTHAGTHVDAPAHFFPDGATVESLALETLMGKVVVGDVSGREAIASADLIACRFPSGTERVLLKTGWVGRMREQGMAAWEAYPGLTPDAACWLIEQQVRLVGIESPSIERFDGEAAPVHHMLLAAGVVVVEGLDLTAVQEGVYWLSCLPLKLVGGDGSPARVVLTEAG